MSGGKCPAFIRPADLERGRWPGATDGWLDDVVKASSAQERRSQHDERLPGVSAKPEVTANSDAKGNNEEGRPEPGDQLHHRRQPSWPVARNIGRQSRIRRGEPPVRQDTP